jgi:hypothetical protein
MGKIKGTVGTETTVPFTETEMVTGTKPDLRAKNVERLLGTAPPEKE